MPLRDDLEISFPRAYVFLAGSPVNRKVVITNYFLMGLDMYAARRHFVKRWEHQQPEERYSVTVTKGGKPVAGIQPESISIVEEQVMYWRKANHIHQWFVENVQDGQDNCGTYYVSENKLRELLDACKRVLETSELVDGMTTFGTAYDEEHPDGIALRRIGKVLMDDADARCSLPRQSGFFFGSLEYDEDYLRDIQETHDWLVRMLDEASCGTNASIYYRSSW